jgi:uncharacterized membrane protein
MIDKLKNLNRLNITLLLIVMSLFSFGLSVTRLLIYSGREFLFLNWNLFLAFIPWLISSIIIIRGINKKATLIVLILLWLLFFPNSPYILTDLFYLKLYSPAPIWFELIIILSFAWTGLMFGFISLLDIDTLLKRYLNDRLIIIITIAFIFLSSFGVYLGRFLRWNSWDILTNPYGLYSDIVDQFANPSVHHRTWGVTILMGLLLNMMYFSIKFLRDRK